MFNIAWLRVVVQVKGGGGWTMPDVPTMAPNRVEETPCMGVIVNTMGVHNEVPLAGLGGGKDTPLFLPYLPTTSVSAVVPIGDCA